jgi:inorganic pyrophosphatase
MKLSIGDNPPEEVNVIVEVPVGADPIKYELDKDSGAIFVDRYLYTAMFYPCNYGFIPHTLADDGDPIDVMVIGRLPVQPGVVLRSVPIGVLKMEDEAGIDAKILCKPTTKITPVHRKTLNYTDVPEIDLQRIAHFFSHYKDLEPDKWVKVEGWGDADEAKQIIRDGIEAEKNNR